MIPYLIQRAKIQNRDFKKGIDSILLFDYMGSSEFEWGALPNGLKEIRENIEEYIYSEYSFKNEPSKVVTVFCSEKHQEAIGEVLEGLVTKKYRLKEYCDLANWVSKEEYSSNTNDFWWDIENHYMFWKKNDNFESKFKTLINPTSI